MNYRIFGHTGELTSVIGMGGMRFDRKAIERGDLQACANVVLYAFQKGINYFDTAPKYCQDRSLDILALALKQLDRSRLYLASKASPDNSGEQDADQLLQGIEGQLRRLGTSYIDFFYLWCVLDLAMFRRYEKMGILDGLRRAKELGLIRHICLSTHASGPEISQMLETGLFEGCLLNYNAINFVFRQQALDTAARLGIGVVTMNPLGGGLIPQNPDVFRSLQIYPEESVAQAAIRFNASHSQIQVVLVGASNCAQIEEAIAVLQTDLLHQSVLRQLKTKLPKQLAAFCTMCGYCEEYCPVKLPIAKLMDAYNQRLLSPQSCDIIPRRIDQHWDLPLDLAGQCIGCGRCEKRCTQHLSIRQRINEIVRASQGFLNT